MWNRNARFARVFFFFFFFFFLAVVRVSGVPVRARPAPGAGAGAASHAGAARFAWNWALASAGSGTRPSASGTPRRSCTSCGTRRRRPTRPWAGGRRTPSAPTRRRSGTWTGRCATSPSPRRASGRASGSASPGSRSAAGAGTPSGSPAPSAARGTTVTLPRLGVHRHPRADRKLAKRLEDGTARILSATVSRTAQRWFVSFTVEEDRDVPARHARPGTAIGIDLGVKALLTGVDDAGNVIIVPGPRPLRAGLRRLRRASRAHSRKQPGSAGGASPRPGWAACTPGSPTSAPTRCTRPPTMLAARYETVVAEDLNVAGMTRNRKLARAITDQGFGARGGCWATRRPGTAGRSSRWPVLSLLEEVLGLRHGESQAGPVRAHLHVRACGLVIDRDVNAARNLLSLAASGAESLNARGGTLRPRPARHVPPNLEPGTPHGARPGPPPPQRAAAA